MLHSIVYLSSSDPNLTEEDLRKILVVARLNNEELDITGVLLYGRGSFIQVLEGQKNHIDYLYERIRADERHSNLIQLISTPILERSFPEWRMGFRRIRDLKEEYLLNRNFKLENIHFRKLPSQNPYIFQLLETFKKYNYN